MRRLTQPDRQIAERRNRHPQGSIILHNSLSGAACTDFAESKPRILRDTPDTEISLERQMTRWRRGWPPEGGKRPRKARLRLRLARFWCYRFAPSLGVGRFG